LTGLALTTPSLGVSTMVDPAFLVDYHFGSGLIANPDGSVRRPAPTSLRWPTRKHAARTAPRARLFHGNSRLLSALTLSDIDAARFTIAS